MESIEHDVFICCRDAAGQELASRVAASLTARGFHVILQDRAPGGAPDPARLELIAQTPDFVLILTPGVLTPGDPAGEAVRAEVADAIRHKCAILTVAAPGFTGFDSRDLTDELAPIVASHRIVYNPERSPESLEMVAHALSSDVSVDDRRLWRWGRFGFMLVGLAFLLTVANAVVPPIYEYWTRPVEKPAIPPFALYWAAHGERQEGGRTREVEVAETALLKRGDRLRVLFSPSADGFAYVIARNTRGELSVLFPPGTMQGASRVRSGTVYEAPASPGWLTIGEAGIDALYILAGYDPLQHLEELAEDDTGELSAALRREALDLTLQGLHAPVSSKTWTRNRDPIVRSLAIPEGPALGRMALDDGTVVQRRLIRQAGVLSAAVELRLRFQPSDTR